jgi:hypothetical protein
MCPPAAHRPFPKVDASGPRDRFGRRTECELAGGIGLANVRGRLASLYGDRGRLAIYDHEPCEYLSWLTVGLANTMRLVAATSVLE